MCANEKIRLFWNEAGDLGEKIQQEFKNIFFKTLYSYAHDPAPHIGESISNR